MPDDDVTERARATAEALEAKAASVADDLRATAIEAASGLQSTMQALAGQMIALAREMKALSSYGRRNRRLIRLLTVSVVMDVVLSLGLAYVFVRSNANSNKLRDQCITRNEARANNVKLWDHILEITPDSADPVAHQRRVDFKAFIDKTFEQTPCGPSEDLVPPMALEAVLVVGLVGGGAAIVRWRFRSRRRKQSPVDPAGG